MATHRFEIDATAGPAREGVLGGRSMLLIRVRMFDGPGVIDTFTGEPAGGEDVVCDLRPDEARELAFTLRERPSSRDPGSWQATPSDCWLATYSADAVGEDGVDGATLGG